MKILLVTERFRPLLGGAETVLWELARELTQLSNSVTVLTARWAPEWSEVERADGVRIIRLPRPRLRFWGTWRYMRALRGWLVQHGSQFDLWYASMLKHSAWVCVAAGLRLGVPVVLRPEGAGPTGDVHWQSRAWTGRWIRRRCQQATAIVSLSPRIREELEHSGYRSGAIRDIPNGVPIPNLEPPKSKRICRERLGMDPAGPVAVYLGRLSPEKGVADLIDSWERVRSEIADAQLVIVGSGPEESELKTRAEGKGGIIWAGATQGPQQYLWAADVFVLPSYEEAMSVAMLEAMALAVPIVATNIPGNRALVESGRHGVLVSPRRPGLLADAIILQLRAKSLAKRMALAARERVQEDFSITRMAQRHLELFESLRRQ